MTQPIVALSGVHKYYGDFHALRGIDLAIAPGTFFSLLGPSGCGKTTLLRTIAGFEHPDEGRLTLDGQDMARVPANRRPTNMVFQSYAIFPHLSVAQNVGFGLRRARLSRADRDARVTAALDLVGLGGFGARAAHALSGGQRQRVALARALILEPKVLLLDEPLSALDKKLREQMQSELRRLQRQVGITFVLVTHDQEEALIMSDRIAVMFDGQIAQDAAPEHLYRRPVSRRVAEFIGVMNFLPADIGGDQAAPVAEIAGLGRAPVDPAQIAATGLGPAQAGIRPETLTILYDAPSDSARTAPATIVEETYYGDMTYYTVRLDGAERPVTISMRNLPGRDILHAGARARVGWSPEALVFFP